MKRYRTSVVSFVALALVVGFAATALSAKARPLKLKGVSQVQGDPFAGAPIATIGTGTHLGKFTGEGFVTFTLLDDETILGEGTQTLIAANGDEVFTEFSGILDPATGEATVNFVITGGTGRFEDASGEFVADVQTIGDARPTFTFTTSGEIVY